ncbi:hypothetical protein A2823_01920 [Candidatus Nomurabacteria bacterium RIFCSPHIGHO2_01_FULL_41_91]|uniref:Uncharacterized protein n=1 Tax=Candidatus Nomurabacteria bacterium RIFCSPLOWO2_12_FULL_41_10 TaxID=1801795 RepID=A0A1F6YA34_9BACT|nr:MAG: hypothetical protein A2823_01920 [Candidatus Nomurabacteria bacterium RIFCSPHIGHO2_01_FULL_41_91]OGI80294.1 MAG: hypothetical protein A3D43_01305 [Candidatus Nomurabacteria bacterium RIFCSPHIGHO2_02_FULL_41_52]OGI84972.1 MAG: hypothetical protein A3F49_00470 [Candidatus Nomurabacteria bacterium RIFCSPHIGHO2_12_FULL_42_19]OGI94192.1 MAG: hypothetical protein A3A07_00340 [Candidatus Nomurabacteria bacterium RIFCSPLOWO2_01_FULL_41_52]OGI98029.1 MAG: hypothetical protein A3H56_02600 [Candid
MKPNPSAPLFSRERSGKRVAEKTKPCKAGCGVVIEKGATCYRLVPDITSAKSPLFGDYCSESCAGRALWMAVGQKCTIH